MANHHQTTVWEKVFYVCFASNKQIQGAIVKGPTWLRKWSHLGVVKICWHYFWWKKSCTRDEYPIISRVWYIPGGAGFPPSTVVLFFKGACLHFAVPKDTQRMSPYWVFGIVNHPLGNTFCFSNSTFPTVYQAVYVESHGFQIWCFWNQQVHLRRNKANHALVFQNPPSSENRLSSQIFTKLL